MNSAGFYFFNPKILKCLIVAVLVPAIFLHPFSSRSAYAASDDVVINEVQTAGIGSGNAGQEFVELRNFSSQSVSIDGWKIVYSSSSDITQQQLIELDGQIAASGFVLLVSQTYSILDGVIADREFTSSSGMSAAGGHVKLIDKSGMERDRIGWGSAQFAESSAAPAPAAGSTLQRLGDDTDNNFADFEVSDPTPTGGDLESLDEPAPTDYPGVTISELLPDPASPKTDSEDEFVELYNPNPETVNLEGYVLQAGNSFQYEFVLPEFEIRSRDFLVLYSAETNVTLSNTSGRARLLNPDREILHGTDAYSSVGEGKSWALINDKWQVTNDPTPGEVNKPTKAVTSDPNNSGLAPCPTGKFRNPVTNRCKTIESDTGLKPCNSDQFRNPSTNRCKKIEGTTGLTPCRTGQVRNPETNRCRSVITTASALKPCAPDQFRNPATNRCKKKDSVTTLVPCKAGQERNVETNRCRKVAGVSTSNPLASPAAATQTNVNVPVIIAVGVIALGYALYEYRQEIKQRAMKLIGKSANK